ncbi:hypothetical protein HYU14_01640 [Candidatus Woesearchaeota archaeon]|nr:hypothetical protein [Candidatus Woesearchaeota archaeon]
MPKAASDTGDQSNIELTLLQIERSKVRREKAQIALNKGLMLYFSFLVVGVFGFTFKYITSAMLNVLVVIGIFILIISSLPYILISHREEQWLNQKIAEALYRKR